jgi:hypothetical protein
MALGSLKGLQIRAHNYYKKNNFRDTGAIVTFSDEKIFGILFPPNFGIEK